MTQRTYDSDEGEFIDFDTLADWQERDLAKNARIKALQTQLETADEIIQWYLNHDETNEGDIPMPDRGNRTWNEINAYFIEGNRKAERFLAEIRAGKEST